MHYSILHLSDLHRDLADEVDNPALLESLSRDIARFSENDPPIPQPALAVVSGDLVYGIKPDHPDGRRELERQYEQAEQFLSGLADRFFAGDRNRVVLVPGNHDVAYPQVMCCLDRIDIPSDEAQRARLIANLWAPNTKYRWHWQALSLYAIRDAVAYEKRLEPFSNMYARFYKGTRRFPLLPEDQVDTFDFPDVQFTCFALNSCYRNDPMHRRGSIHPTCLAKLSELARTAPFRGRILAATWHHNLSGGPQRDDYLEPELLQFLIDAGVTLGFHGHQHRSEYIDQRFVLDARRRYITVLSAGSLCSGPAGLPVGESRSFNVVEIDSDTLKGRLHQRRMSNSDFVQPIWTHGHFKLSQQSYIDFNLCPPPTKRRSGAEERLRLERAEECIRAGQYREALDLLAPLKNDPDIRPLAIAALSRAGDDAVTMAYIERPGTPEEAVLLGTALLGRGTTNDIEQFLSLGIVTSDTDASVREVTRLLKRKIKR